MLGEEETVTEEEGVTEEETMEEEVVTPEEEVVVEEEEVVSTLPSKPVLITKEASQMVSVITDLKPGGFNRVQSQVLKKMLNLLLNWLRGVWSELECTPIFGQVRLGESGGVAPYLIE